PPEDPVRPYAARTCAGVRAPVGGALAIGETPLLSTIFSAWQVASPFAATALQTCAGCSLAAAGAAEAVGTAESAAATRDAAPTATTIQDFFTGAPSTGRALCVARG